MRLVGSVAAQPSTRNPHEIEGSSVGQPKVKWKREGISGVDGQKNGEFLDSPPTHHCPEPRQRWCSGQKKARPIKVRLSNLVVPSLLPNDSLLGPMSTYAGCCGLRVGRGFRPTSPPECVPSQHPDAYKNSASIDVWHRGHENCPLPVSTKRSPESVKSCESVSKVVSRPSA